MGRTITTHLIDGTPQGVRMIYISNKSCMAVVIPRSQMANVLSFKELNKCALYILIGESDEGEPKAYIGETGNFSKRVKYHEQKKDFWSKVLVFVSQNETQIDKADVQYLEAKAIQQAYECKQFVLNENKQNPDIPRLPEHKKESNDEFFDDIIFLASFLGCNIFEKTSFEEDSTLSTKQPFQLFLSTRDGRVNAKAIYNEYGVLVLAGSVISSETSQSCPNRENRIRQLAELTEHSSGKHILKLNKQFGTPSAASCFCLGQSSNGKQAWRNKENITLSTLLELGS